VGGGAGFKICWLIRVLVEDVPGLGLAAALTDVTGVAPGDWFLPTADEGVEDCKG